MVLMMSRIGKLPIKYDNDVHLSVDSDILTVVGPRGSLTQSLHPGIVLDISDGIVKVSCKEEFLGFKAFWGLYRSLVNNMVIGVKDGYSISLEINGTGYKASVSGDYLLLSLGYSHDIFCQIPEGLSIAVKKNVITVSGASKQKVGQFAAEIRSLRKPEPYKGKGVKYANEVIKKKEGKKK